MYLAESILNQALATLQATISVWWHMWPTQLAVFVLILSWAAHKAAYHDQEKW